MGSSMVAWIRGPTFLGCNDTTTRLIVYVPNYPWSYYGNTSKVRGIFDPLQCCFSHPVC